MKRTDRLGSFRGDQGQQDQEADPDRSHRDAQASRDAAIDGAEKEWPRDREECQGGRDRNRRRDAGIGGAKPKDRSKEDVNALSSIRAARPGRKDRKEERP